jgi:hypothetical protein
MTTKTKIDRNPSVPKFEPGREEEKKFLADAMGVPTNAPGGDVTTERFWDEAKVRPRRRSVYTAPDGDSETIGVSERTLPNGNDDPTGTATDTTAVPYGDGEPTGASVQTLHTPPIARREPSEILASTAQTGATTSSAPPIPTDGLAARTSPGRSGDSHQSTAASIVGDEAGTGADDTDRSAAPIGNSKATAHTMRTTLYGDGEPTGVSAHTPPIARSEPSEAPAPTEPTEQAASTAPTADTADSLDARSNTDPDYTRRTVKQRRGDLDEYRRRFMQAPKIEDRKPVFVSRATRDRLDRIVRLLGERGMSVSGLIENIALQHLATHESDVEYWRRI